MLPNPTPDEIRAAIRRYLAALAREEEAKAALRLAQDAAGAATTDKNAAAQSLGNVAGAGAFVLDGKLVTVVPVPLNVLSSPNGPTITVQPIKNLTELSPVPVMAAPANPPKSPPPTQTTASVPVSGGKSPASKPTAAGS